MAELSHRTTDPATLPELVTRILDESDLCRSETADDVADLLDEAAREIVRLRGAIRLWADECAECGGSGEAFERTYGLALDPKRVVSCPQCADIREYLK